MLISPIMAQVEAFALCLCGSKRRPRRCRSNIRPNLVCQPGPGPSWGLFSGAQGKTLAKPQPRPGARSLGSSPLGPVKQISISYSAPDLGLFQPRLKAKRPSPGRIDSDSYILPHTGP